MRRPSIVRLLVLVALLWTSIILLEVLYKKEIFITKAHSQTLKHFFQKAAGNYLLPSINDTNIVFHRAPTKEWNNTELVSLRKEVDLINHKQEIRNQHLLPDTSEKGIVLLFQVHDRPQELELAVKALRGVKGIEKSLVIFSHDLYLPSINKIIHTIDFCPVLQIFYPYSRQLYPGRFPDDSPDDCPRDIGKEKAKKIGCTNAEHPDKYGHYREGRFTQMKHHWLWKIQYVFNDLKVLMNFKGLVLRLDNDYYLAPDILHVIRILHNNGNQDGNKLLILGNYESFKDEDFTINGNSFSTGFWYTGIGRGMAFTKRLWHQFSECADVFCKFDDYNWDWSFQQVALSCLKGLPIIKPKGSRLFHIGKCQGFHNKKQCSAVKLVADVENYLKSNQKYLFPQNMTKIDKDLLSSNKIKPGGYGGWADIRDHELCLSILKSNSAIEHVIKKYSR